MPVASSSTTVVPKVAACSPNISQQRTMLSAGCTKRATFRVAAFLVALLVIWTTIGSGLVHRIRSAAMQGRTFDRPDDDRLLESVISSDGDAMVYRFVSGTISVMTNQSYPMPPGQQVAKANSAYLKTMYESLTLKATADCSLSRRFGRRGDTGSGGGDLCLVGQFKPRHPCYGFSFGVNGTWEFEEELATSLGCQVLAFDPAMQQVSHMRSERLLLLREGLRAAAANGTAQSPPADSYLGYLKRFKADGLPAIDVLKVDVGHLEWPALDAAVRDGSLRRVKQLLLCTRTELEASVQLLRRYLFVLRGLHELGFRQWKNSHSDFDSQPKRSGQIGGGRCQELNYINVNFILDSQKAINPAGIKIALPPEGLAISRSPGYGQLDTVRRANLSALSAAQLDALYFSLVEQQHLFCPHSRRIGDIDDGGWDVCFSDPFSIDRSRPCVVFSFGINNVWAYDDQLADRYHCMVHMFDPSMTNVNDHQRRNTSWFYRIGLSSNNTVAANGWKMRTLCRLFKELGYANRTIDILKIDIDYWEWVVFEKALEDGCLRQVKQFMFETHTTGMFKKKSDYARFIRILVGVFDIGFRTWMWHKNPHSTFYKSDSGLTRACCYEHYLLNTNLLQP